MCTLLCNGIHTYTPNACTYVCATHSRAHTSMCDTCIYMHAHNSIPRCITHTRQVPRCWGHDRQVRTSHCSWQDSLWYPQSHTHILPLTSPPWFCPWVPSQPYPCDDTLKGMTYSCLLQEAIQPTQAPFAQVCKLVRPPGAGLDSFTPRHHSYHHPLSQP